MATSTPVARAAGRVLAVAIAAIAAVRRRWTKPLHPRGEVVAATLTTWGGRQPWGAPLLDDEDAHACFVRFSRAVGLPRGWPDIRGVAIRIAEDDHAVDLLFATTGTGLVSRYVLLARRDPGASLTTIMPLRSVRGPVQLRLDADGPRTWVLSAAVMGSSRWDRLARLRVHLEAAGETSDVPVRFDPIGNLPRGLEQYPAVRAVREPGYVQARREPVRAR